MIIRRMERFEAEVCAAVIRASFATVAEEFGITRENCPKHTSFIELEKLIRQYETGRKMFVCDDGKIIGFFSLDVKEDKSAHLDNLAIMPEHRHKGFGKEMLDFALDEAKYMGVEKLKIGIIEENNVLKNWYIKNGFTHTGTKKFDHLPFTVGYMEKDCK